MSTLQLNTVADFKRAIKVGTKLHCVYHKGIAGYDEKRQPIWKDIDKGERIVSIVQSNKFALATPKTDGSVENSWLDFPKREEVVFNGNKATILEQDIANNYTPVLTYTFVD